jgi:hypothetical protein
MQLKRIDSWLLVQCSVFSVQCSRCCSVLSVQRSRFRVKDSAGLRRVDLRVVG